MQILLCVFLAVLALPASFSGGLSCEEDVGNNVPAETSSSLNKRGPKQDYGLHVAPDLESLVRRSFKSKKNKRKNCFHNGKNNSRKNSKRKKDLIDDTVAKEKIRITNLQKSIHKNLLRLFHRLKNGNKKPVLPTRKSSFANPRANEPLVKIGNVADNDEIKKQDSAKTLDDPAFESTESGDLVNVTGTASLTEAKDIGSSSLQNAKNSPLDRPGPGSVSDSAEKGSTAHEQNNPFMSNSKTKEVGDAKTAAGSQPTDKTVLKPLTNLSKSTLSALHRLVHKFFPNAVVQKTNGEAINSSSSLKLATSQLLPKLAYKLRALESNKNVTFNYTANDDALSHLKDVDKKLIGKDPYAEIAAGPDHPKAPPGIKITSDTQPMLNFGMPSDLSAPQEKNDKEKEVKTGDEGGATHGGLVNPDVPERLPEIGKDGGGRGGAAELMRPDFPFPDNHGRLNPGFRQTAGGLNNQDLADQTMLDSMRERAMQEQMQERLRAQAMQGFGTGFGGINGMAGMPGMGVGFPPPGGFGSENGGFGDGEGIGRDSVYGGFPGNDFPDRAGFEDDSPQPLDSEDFNEYGYGPAGGGIDVPAVGRNEVPREPQHIYRKPFDEDTPFDGYDTNSDDEMEDNEFDEREPGNRFRPLYGMYDRQNVEDGGSFRDRFAFDDDFENEPEMDDGFDAKYDRKNKIAKIDKTANKKSRRILIKNKQEKNNKYHRLSGNHEHGEKDNTS